MIDMIQINPEARKSVAEYLQEQRGKAFPEYFYDFMHSYMPSMLYMSANNDQYSSKLTKSEKTFNGSLSDQRILKIFGDFDQITEAIGTSDVGKGYLILLPVICSCSRSCVTNKAKRALLQLISRIAKHVKDSIRLDRLLPHTFVFLKDEDAGIRSLAIVTIIEIVYLIT